MKKILVLLSFAFTLSACKKDTINRINIFGQWQWENSVGGFTGRDTIQPSPNSTVILTLKDDMSYTTALNGQVTSRGTFQISSVNNQKILQINNFTPIEGLWLENNGVLIKIDNNKLHLADYQVSEPYTHNFK